MLLPEPFISHQREHRPLPPDQQLAGFTPEPVEFANVTPPSDKQHCRIDRDGRILFLDAVFASALVAQDDLYVQDNLLMPVEHQARQEWVLLLRQVLRHNDFRLFSVNQLAGTSFIAMMPCKEPTEIEICLPEPYLCSPATIRHYAKLVGLTPRETLVTEKTTLGLTPTMIAAELQTRESTVRTQVKSILAKSNHHSVRALLITLARLPSVQPEGSSPEIQTPAIPTPNGKADEVSANTPISKP